MARSLHVMLSALMFSVKQSDLRLTHTGGLKLTKVSLHVHSQARILFILNLQI